MNPKEKTFYNFKIDNLFHKIMEDIQSSGLPILKNCSPYQKNYILPNEFLNLIHKNIKK